MLQISKPRPLADSGATAPELISPAELYAVVMGFVRRRFPVIAFTVMLILALATIYIVGRADVGDYGVAATPC